MQRKFVLDVETEYCGDHFTATVGIRKDGRVLGWSVYGDTEEAALDRIPQMLEFIKKYLDDTGQSFEEYLRREGYPLVDDVYGDGAIVRQGDIGDVGYALQEATV